MSSYQERGASAATLEKDYTWTQDPVARPYVGSVTTTMDPGQTYQAQTKTAQTLDLYGNITQSQIFDYGNLSTAARTYNYTYLADSNGSQYMYGPCACSPLGKMTAVSQPYAPGTLPVCTTYTYDSSGRTLTTTSPDGSSVTRYTYQGNQTTVTDPAGKWKPSPATRWGT